MNKLLALSILLAFGLVACAPSEPAADTSGVVHQDDAPPTSGDSSGGAPATGGTQSSGGGDAAEGSSEGG